MKEFTHAGVSTLKGKTKARFATSEMRVKVLIKSGHTDIDMLELPYAMNKVDALKYLLKINFDNGNAAIREVLKDELTKRASEDTEAVESEVEHAN
jgi:hypothetical protein